MATPAYVFLTEDEYQNVVNSCTLSAHNVGAKESSKNGFPIFLDIETAYARARKTFLAGQHAALAHDSKSLWKLVTLHFTHAQWVRNLLPQNGEPLFAVAKGHISVRSDLCLQGVSASRDDYHFSAHSVEEWASARLHKRRKVANKKCAECGKLGPVAWRGSLGNHLRHKAADDDDTPKAYCAVCWDAYFVSKK